MVTLRNLTNDGFDLAAGAQERHLKSVALLTLESAVKAYFSTYKTMRLSLHLFDNTKLERPTIEFNHNHDYAAASTECLLHFQHFAELTCKDLLVEEIAAGQLSRPAKNVHRLNFGNVLDLLVAHSPARVAQQIASRHEHTLRELARLRNHLIHEGTFVLLYPALDQLVGEYILPFVSAVVALPQYSTMGGFWRHAPLASGIDPLSEVEMHFAAGRYDLRQIAYLKELGRAAYASPMRAHPIAKAFNERYRLRYENVARSVLEREHDVREARKCPVCGVNALVLFVERDHDEETGDAWWYIYEVQCFCCSFQVNDALGNASAHGVSIEDYFSGGNL
ncbi:MAG TPA: hypothetical protein VF092_18130 [Longimicrobium sp.]